MGLVAVNAQQYGRTFDCATPGCPRETDRHGGQCDHCRRWIGPKRLIALAEEHADLTELRKQTRQYNRRNG